MKTDDQPSRTISRRGFVGAVVAGGLAPTIVPQRAFGANSRPQIGIIGYAGGPATGLVGRGGRNSVLELVAVCDVRRDKREVFKDRKEVSVYVDYREMLERPDIDGVIIGTPEHAHAVPAVHAARAGKDIYCEKPMAFTIGECQTIVREVQRAGVVFQTGSQQRSDFGGHFRRAYELIRSGRIGDIQEIHVSPLSVRKSTLIQFPGEKDNGEVDWDKWLGPAATRPYSWTLCRSWKRHGDFSAGSQTDGGAHIYDIVQWVMDADDSGPVEVIPPNAEKGTPLTYRYANGVPVYGDGKGCPTVWSVHVVGSKGTVTVHRSAIVTDPWYLVDSPISSTEVRLPPSPGHIHNWIECMHTCEKPICHEEVGARSATMCHLGNIAYRLNRPLKWDPEKQVFEDAEANRLMDYAHREPWNFG